MRKLDPYDPAPFWAKVDIRGPNDCWPWLGMLGHAGYGEVKRRQKILRTHRVAYVIAFGTIGEGLFVCHRCDNKVCCNPAHLFLGTHTDNMRDMASKGRGVNQKKASCPNGHPYEQMVPGKRFCRICHNAWARERYAAGKAA